MLNAVEISHLTVKYPEVVALDDVSFVIKQGDFLGIIGPNGAGKSTLFDSMLGLNTSYTGTIKFFDQDIKKSKTYHKEIGYVPQKPEFENNFPATVSDVVRMGLRKKSDDKICTHSKGCTENRKRFCLRLRLLCASCCSICIVAF